MSIIDIPYRFSQNSPFEAISEAIVCYFKTYFVTTKVKRSVNEKVFLSFFFFPHESILELAVHIWTEIKEPSL